MSPWHNAIHAYRDIRNYGAGEAGKKVRAQLAANLSETNPVMLADTLRQSQARARNFGLLSAASRGPGLLAGAAAGRAGGGLLSVGRN